MAAETIERRRSARSTTTPPFAITVRHARTLVPARSVNFSNGGLCFRFRHLLEVRSLIRLRLTPEASASGSSAGRASQPVDCTARVAWVVQRLDLAEAASALYDVGIEFVDPPPTLRQLIARAGGRLSHADKGGELPSVIIRDRRYLPRVAREGGHALPWHLIVLVEGSPCFSGRYATKWQAVGAWTRFRRQQATPHTSEGRQS